MEKLTLDFMFIGKGVLLSLQLMLGGIVIGLIIGSLFAILCHNNMGNFFIKRLISIIRGTPLILQLSFIYFALPGLINCKISIEIAGIIAFGLNSAAYIAEIFRSGIGSIDVGQFEAAKTLQIPKFYIWKDIILPQVIKNILPSITNETIALLKETALISTIGGMDIMRRYQVQAAEQFTYFIPLCIAGFYYYVMVIIIEGIGKTIERRMSYDKN